MGVVSCVRASFEQGRKHHIDILTLINRKAPDIPVIFLERESIYMAEWRSQGCQFLATLYLADLEETPGAAPEELTNNDVLLGDMDGKAD